MLDEPAAPLELLHRPPARHRLEVDGRVRDLGRLGDPPDLGLGGLEGLARRRPDVDFERAPFGDDVGPRPAGDQPDVDGHARPASVEVVELAHDPGGLEDRAAALLRLDAGVGRPPVDDDPQVEDALARRHDVAVGAGALEHERDVAVRRDLADVRRRGRRADLLVGVGDEDEALEGQAAALGDDRLERVQPGQQAGLHVGDAGPVGDAVLDPERARGRGPGVEDGVHVPDEQRPRSTRAASNVAMTVSPRRPAGSGRVSTSAPSSARNAATQRPTSLTPSGV